MKGSLFGDLVLVYELARIYAREWKWGTSYLFDVVELNREFLIFFNFICRSITIESIGNILTSSVLFPSFSNLVVSLLMAKSWEDNVSEKVMVGAGLEGVIICVCDRDLLLPMIGIKACVD